MLPGGFLYTSDVDGGIRNGAGAGRNPGHASITTRQPDFVLTMETKGIPIALMTARMLNVPLVIARRDSRAYEGSAVKINYIAGGGKRPHRDHGARAPRRAPGTARADRG